MSGTSRAKPDSCSTMCGRLTIDLAALRRNYLALRETAGSAGCAAAVKADGYGVGARRVVRTLRESGCTVFFVALLDEAVDILPEVGDGTVYVLNGIVPGTAKSFARHGIRPVLGNLEEIGEWAECCRLAGSRLPAALHIDTGINRLGLEASSLEKLAGNAALLGAFETSLVMSHFACADDPGDPMNGAQREAFTVMKARLPEAPASLANSAATLSGAENHFDLVRPGIALYGGRALAGRPNPMRPVVHLTGRIMQVRQVAAGSRVGYGATWTARRDSRIAVVGAGYADGYIRLLGGSDDAIRAHVFIDGQFAPVVGRVSMDMMTVDVTGIDPDAARRGATVELLGRNITVDDLADAARTIGYEVLTSLGSRYGRVYSPA